MTADEKIEQLREELKLESFFDYQLEFFRGWLNRAPGERYTACLYHRTGAGKTVSAMTAMKLAGVEKVLVIAPPVTHVQWKAVGDKLGLAIRCTSHAAYRQKGFRMSRNDAVIVDEFHLFGGNTAKGWKIFEQRTRASEAPLIICSATPNYNDAERVYCIKRILHPNKTHDGYVGFLYADCELQQNYFSTVPDVVGFKEFDTAEDYLKAMPDVYYVPDIHKATLVDIELDLDKFVPDELATYGLNDRRERVEASIIGKTWAELFYKTLDDDGFIRTQIIDELINATMDQPENSKLMLYADSKVIAEALQTYFEEAEVNSVLVTGDLTLKEKTARLDSFRSTAEGSPDVLVGTGTLGTGTDGLDQVCDWLIIVHDTNDDAKRRQIMGRILPRGAMADVSKKVLYRFCY